MSALLKPTITQQSIGVPNDPRNIFTADEGGLYIFSPRYMYTDTAGTINVTAQDDVVGNITDNSGNGNTLVAVSDAARSLAKTDGTNWWIQLDKVDDNYSTTFASPIVGTMLIGTRLGTIHIEVNIPAGAWSLTPTPAYFPGNTITDIILKDGYMTDAELANAEAWLASRGSPVIFAPTGTTSANGFRGRTDLLVILSSNWNTAAATTFIAFAFDCTNLTILDVSGWNTAAVTTFRTFAYNCSSLTALDVSGWNTSAVTTFQSFASGCTNLTALDVSGWNTSAVTTFQSFAYNCSSLTALDVSGWNTSAVTTFYAFAYNCSSLTALDVSGWNTSAVTSFYAFAYNCSSLTALDVSGWNTSAVTTFQSFAAGCTNLTALDVSGWNTSAVTTFQSFAANCINLTTVIIAGGAGNPFADSLCTNYAFAFTNTNLTQQSIDNILVAINTAGTSGGTFNQSGGSAPSATGNAAIDALRVRGWTITVTGGY